MNILKTKHSSPTLTLVVLLSLPIAAHAETLTGKINGHTCAHSGTNCPVDRMDPHLALEPDLVLMVGDKHYFMPDIGRHIKRYHVLEDVQVVGIVDPKYPVIKVEELRVKKENDYVRVWNIEETLSERCKDAPECVY